MFAVRIWYDIGPEVRGGFITGRSLFVFPVVALTGGLVLVIFAVVAQTFPAVQPRCVFKQSNWVGMVSLLVE